MPLLTASIRGHVRRITGSRHYRSMLPLWRVPTNPIPQFINSRCTSLLKPPSLLSGDTNGESDPCNYGSKQRFSREGQRYTQELNIGRAVLYITLADLHHPQSIRNRTAPEKPGRFMSASRSSSVTERLLSPASPKSMPASSFSIHSWPMPASAKNHGTSSCKFSCV